MAHVLIKEGCLQVIAQPHSAPSSSELNGLSRHVTTADYIIEGSLEFRDNGYHLIVQLFNSADGSYTWSEAADFEYPDLRGVVQLAQSLLRELVAPPDHAVIARRHSEHKEIRDFYLQGRYNWKLATPDSIRNSVACFSQRRGSAMKITPPDGRRSAKSLARQFHVRVHCPARGRRPDAGSRAQSNRA